MSSSQADFDKTFFVDKKFFYKQVEKLQPAVIEQFEFIAKSYTLFNLVFFLIAFVELTVLSILFPTYTHSSVFSISLALLFLTVFSYLILRLYFSARKPEHYLDLKEQYVHACKEIINYQDNIPEHHIAIAGASFKLINMLDNKELDFYTPPYFLDMFKQTCKKLSAYLHWEDTLRFKENLYQASIEEHLKLVKCEPTNLEIHASLANALVMLSSLYSTPLKSDPPEEYDWLCFDNYQEELEEKFKATSKQAMEEFKILNDYAPEDPWVHIQLAYSYRDLQMPEEEIKEYETILKLCPDDTDSLLKLGTLYFQQGFNAKGLKTYQRLKQKDFQKAENLIKHYGQKTSYDFFDFDLSD